MTATASKLTRTHEEIDGDEMFVNSAYWNISIIRFDDTGELDAIISRQQAHTGKYIVTHMLPNKVSKRAAELLKADRLLSSLVELTATLKARTQPAPVTNTESAQLDADLAEQPAESWTPANCTTHKHATSKGITLAVGHKDDSVYIPAGTVGCLLGEPMHNYSDGAPCSRPHRVLFYVGRASYEFYVEGDALTFETSAQPATLLDDVQTLPLFSGTCPRVADPGRFDPPQVSTDRQPALF